MLIRQYGGPTVRCQGFTDDLERCDRTFDVHDQTYFAIAGNIYIGGAGGIIGNNFKDDWELGAVSVYCPQCFAKALQSALFHAIARTQGPKITITKRMSLEDLDAKLQ